MYRLIRHWFAVHPWLASIPESERMNQFCYLRTVWYGCVDVVIFAVGVVFPAAGGSIYYFLIPATPREIVDPAKTKGFCLQAEKVMGAGKRCGGGELRRLRNLRVDAT